MQQIARSNARSRADLWQVASERTGLPELIIEKDFWVCWMLERLWSLPEVAPHLIFKGGTSLSKCFGLIQRFSEDIDIGLDRAVLGFDASSDPEAEGLSRKQRNLRVEMLKTAAREWIEGPLLEQLSAAITAELGTAGKAGWKWESIVGDDGMPQLLWTPPTLARRRTPFAGIENYVQRGIRLEIGSRAANWPAGWHEVKPYAAEAIPEAFTHPTASICTLEPQRTFWEKATILHELYHATQENLETGKAIKQRERFSRHCYDLHCIARHEIGEAAMRDFELLEQVVAFKRKMFCSSNVKEALYDGARPGSLRVIPHPKLQSFFEDDYAKMQSSGMFFGDSPSWSEIMQTLSEIESRVNS